jgi:hypothetical protein
MRDRLAAARAGGVRSAEGEAAAIPEGTAAGAGQEGA